MIVMAVLGGSNSDREQAYFSLTSELGKSSVRRLDLSFLPDPVERARRLKIETSGRYSDDVVTIVFGCSSQEEITALRESGAVVCHYYGAFTKLYETQPIHTEDLIVSEADAVPRHVMSIVEAWSECYIRTRTHKKTKKAVA